MSTQKIPVGFWHDFRNPKRWHQPADDGYLPSILPAAAAIASGVLLMAFHNPIDLAEDVATGDVLSCGRFELGVGIGFKGRSPARPSPSRVNSSISKMSG